MTGLAELDGLPSLQATSVGYPFRHFVELLNRPRPKWLVEGLFPAVGVGVLYGDSGSRKSFKAFDLAVAVAAECDHWHGYPIVRHGPGRIILGEGQDGAPNRIAAAAFAHGVIDLDTLDVQILEAPPNLMDTAAMLRLAAQLKAEDQTPAVVVFDTFSACAPGGEGSHFDSATVGGAFANLSSLARDLEALVIVVDHPNNQDKSRPNGSFLKKAGPDGIWFAEIDADTNQSTLKIKKLKDAPFDEKKEMLRFDLVPMRRGEEGSPVYLRAAEELVSLDDLKRADGLTLKALAEIATEQGATDGEWKEVSVSEGISRPGYYRARKRLLAGNLVEQKGNRYLPTVGGRMLVSPRLTEVSL